MRTKALLTSILLGSLSLAGVASANPIVRDHRYRPVVTQPAVQVRYDYRTTRQPVAYGYQLSANGRYVQPYTYGNDPYVEGIARGEWHTLESCIDINGHHAQRVALGGRPYQSLELQTTNGSAYLYTVGLIFADGHQEAFKIMRTIDARHEPNLRLDLGRQGLEGVNAVVVDGVGDVSFRLLGA